MKAVSGDTALAARPGPGPGRGRLPERVRPVVHGPGLVLLGAPEPVRARDAHAPARVQRPARALELGDGAGGDRPRRRPGRASSRAWASPRTHSAWEDNNHLEPNAEPGYVDDATGYEKADPVTAARLLEQSGFALDGHGRWTTHGKPVSLDVGMGGRRPLVGGGGADRGRATRGGRLRRRRHAGVDGPALRRRCSRAAPSTSPSSPSTPARIRAHLGDVFSTSPAITGGAASQDWSGFDDPKIDAQFTQAVQDLAPPQAHADLPADRPGAVDRHAHAAAVRRAHHAGVVVVIVGRQDDPGGLGPLWNVRDCGPDVRPAGAQRT